MQTDPSAAFLLTAIQEKDRLIEALKIELSQTCPKFDLHNVSDLSTAKQYISCQFTAVIFSFIGFVLGRLFDSVVGHALAKKFNIDRSICQEFLSPTCIICLQIIYKIACDAIVGRAKHASDRKQQKRDRLIAQQVLLQLNEFRHDCGSNKPVVTVPPTPSPSLSQKKIILPERSTVLPDKNLLLPSTHTDLAKPLTKIIVTNKQPQICAPSPNVVIHATPIDQATAFLKNPFLSVDTFDKKKTQISETQELEAIQIVQ